MSRRGHKREKHSQPSRVRQGAAQSRADVSAHLHSMGRRVWLFRLAVVILTPALFLLLLEAGLRAGGCGYPSAATIPCEVNGIACRGDNVRFGWRFFPRDIAREFDPFIFATIKPRNTYRIFVLGESAAQGTPDCAYGFGRILEAMLDHAHPGTDFEVIVAAMPAINSHVVVEIARDLARYPPDLFVVYMGNNEVIGPYGPGTVFSPLSPHLPLIRAGIRLRSTRTGQLLAGVASSLGAKSHSPKAWAGLEMFVGQQVAADDPRLETVYRHFRRNLEDIRRIALDSGAAVLFCTLGCNLRDCPPFASMHRADLGKDDLAKWTGLYEAGVQHEAEKDFSGAIESYLAATGIDDRYAELQFRLGRCYEQMGDHEKARDRFVPARDLDALRLRPDRRINEIIRQVATESKRERVHLVDAEGVFQAADGSGVPGRELFHEHVHLTFHGDYVLARAIAEQVSRVARMMAGRPLLDETGCARRVGYNAWAHYNTIFKVLNYYLRKPPFTGQLYHDEHVRRLEREVKRTEATLTPDLCKQIAVLYREIIAEVPSDIWLRLRLAEFASVFLNDEQTAVEQCRRVQELVPHSYKPHLLLAMSLARLNRFDEAMEHLRAVLRIKPTCDQAREMLQEAAAAGSKNAYSGLK